MADGYKNELDKLKETNAILQIITMNGNDNKTKRIGPTICAKIYTTTRIGNEMS